jgi:hypothetical protein
MNALFDLLVWKEGPRVRYVEDITLPDLEDSIRHFILIRQL